MPRRVRPDPLDAPTPVELGEIPSEDVDEGGVDWTPVTEDGRVARAPRLPLGDPVVAQLDPTVITGGRPEAPHASMSTPPRPEVVSEEEIEDTTQPTVISGQNRPTTGRMASDAVRREGGRSKGFHLPRIDSVDVSLVGLTALLLAAILIVFAILFAPWPVSWGVTIRLVLLALDATLVGAGMLWLAVDGQHRRQLREDRLYERDQLLREIRRTQRREE